MYWVPSESHDCEPRTSCAAESPLLWWESSPWTPGWWGHYCSSGFQAHRDRRNGDMGVRIVWAWSPACSIGYRFIAASRVPTATYNKLTDTYIKKEQEPRSYLFSGTESMSASGWLSWCPWARRAAPCNAPSLPGAIDCGELPHGAWQLRLCISKLIHLCFCWHLLIMLLPQ